MKINELNQITGENRKKLVAYANAQQTAKDTKKYLDDNKADIVELVNTYGTAEQRNEKTTVTQLCFREDNTLHTAQVELCNKSQADTARYIAYLESLLAENGIAHDKQADFQKPVTSCTVRVLTSEKTKKAVK